MARTTSRNRRLWVPGAMLLALGLGAALLHAAPLRETPAAAVAAAPRAPAPVPKKPQAKPETVLVDFPIRAELPVGRWLRPGEFVWNDEEAPPGEAVVVVNLRGRVLSVYRAGHEIGRSSIVWGSDDKPTPTGAFTILEKDARHRSRTYGNAPMPHMLRLTADGVALHGSEMADDLATHGCVGLPREFAALLFRATRVGGRVLILRG